MPPPLALTLHLPLNATLALSHAKSWYKLNIHCISTQRNHPAMNLDNGTKWSIFVPFVVLTLYNYIIIVCVQYHTNQNYCHRSLMTSNLQGLILPFQMCRRPLKCNGQVCILFLVRR